MTALANITTMTGWGKDPGVGELQVSFLKAVTSDKTVLAGSSDTLLGRLDQLARPLALPPGATLFEQESPGDQLFLLVQGTVEVSVLTNDGRRLALNHVVAGELLGEISFFAGGRRSATAVARTPCRLLSVGREALLAEIHRSPEIAIELLGLLSARLRWLGQQQVEAALYGIEARLARRLLYLLDRGDGPAGEIKLTQQELSEHLGISREKVSRLLSDWRVAGWIEGRRGTLRIVDPTALAALSDFGT